MTKLDREIQETLKPLIAKAETGEQWAEICRLEKEMIDGYDAHCRSCHEHSAIPFSFAAWLSLTTSERRAA